MPDTWVANFNDPDALRDVFQGAEWGESLLFGETYLLVCPLCQSTVLAGTKTYSDGRTMKGSHIDYHLDIAKHLQKRVKSDA